MRAIAALVCAAALSTGCLVVSLQPAYDDNSIVFDERLIGQWENADDRTKAAFEQAEWRSYRVTYTDRAATTTLQGNLTRIGASLYLDLTETRGIDAGPYLVPVHGLYRVNLTADTLTASALNYAWFTRPVTGRLTPGLTMAMDARRNVVLASPTSGLRAWLARAPDGAFDVPMTFAKKASED
jgi:hypothetical protein